MGAMAASCRQLEVFVSEWTSGDHDLGCVAVHAGQHFGARDDGQVPARTRDATPEDAMPPMWDSEPHDHDVRCEWQTVMIMTGQR